MPSARTFARKISSLISRNKFSSSSYKPLSTCLSENARAQQVRRGHIAMYVGDERRRYEVPLKSLKFPALQELIKQSQDDDFDLKIDGPIILASCTPNMFEQLLKRAKEFA
ncbi:hypothetical protein JCGZ_22289 [Jatropha curcas]|uniref:Uncharacterized protein n=1 Tax=Jatropha curcas TaxID=180498 RepID=A0A067K3D2_JATCU|nr:uncharacterized protein LOC105645039 [Jatropha curcas]KDP26304.1 hypothetical protein JCGZ_22289 [Jatropha curcas]